MSEHRLYIVARDDMDSMTPGRVAAQVSHATSAFTIQAERALVDELFPAYVDWKTSTSQHFGTAIILAASGPDLNKIYHEYKSEYYEDLDSLGELIIDPTYVIRDGSTIHLVSVVTCGYFFVSTESHFYKDILSKLQLF